jgi:hypothetical protein
MKSSCAKLILCALGACAALGASAAGMGADNARITNGGTGFIGVTESYGQPGTVAAGSRRGMPAGEASTWVNGRPNENPEAPGMATGGVQTQSMGNTGMSPQTGVPAGARHPSWGTPD